MSPRIADERELVAAAASGDEQAFRQLVDEHADAVYGHALRFFGEKTAAEDATQEVFIKVFRSIASFDGRSRLSTWLFRITRNVCLDIARAGRHRPQPVDPVVLEPLPEPDFADDVVFGEALRVAMSSLPPEDREALGAIGLFGLSYEEAAGSLGVPVGTVKSRVFRARRTLSASLNGMERGA